MGFNRRKMEDQSRQAAEKEAAPPRELAEFLMSCDGDIPMTVSENSELYMVRDAVWKQAGIEPYGGCLCVGCLEKRIGRKLKPKDFVRDHSFNDPRLPCTERA
jgi:hypothetical protein